jgi:hypothetical protein
MYPGESQNEIARRHSTHGLRQVCGGRLINGRFCEQLPFAAAAGLTAHVDSGPSPITRTNG